MGAVAMSGAETAVHVALFPTAIGRCGVAWRGDKIVATHLPEASDARTRARLIARAGRATESDPPPAVRQAIDAMTALLDGAAVDLTAVDCDYGAADPLSVQVYEIARAIPAGETLTYGEIAARLGDKSLAPSVGQALGRNPLPIIVPCHRVVGANRKLTGFSANGGVATKLRMLAIEGAAIGEPAGLFADLPLATKPDSRRRPRTAAHRGRAKT
jgi:methylated-DNA-[protein]-cysteine S-methyltransferase